LKRALLVAALALPIILVGASVENQRLRFPSEELLEQCLSTKPPFDGKLFRADVNGPFTRYTAQNFARRALVLDGVLMASHQTVQDLIFGEDGWTRKPLSKEYLKLDTKGLQAEQNILPFMMAESLTACATPSEEEDSF
jgi:hypothetical protein